MKSLRATAVRRAGAALLVGICGLGAGAHAALGQADATASRGLEISVFGGPAGVFTGLAGSRNVSLTAGLDIGIRSFHGLAPVAEVRGLYPVDGGSVDKQKNVLAGLKVEKRRRGLRVYGDVLFGRGQIEYGSGGYLNPAGNFLYQTSTSTVLSPGAGVSADIGRRLAVFVDAQFQRYHTPVTAEGTLWAKPVTIGIVYRLPFQKHGHPY